MCTMCSAMKISLWISEIFCAKSNSIRVHYAKLDLTDEGLRQIICRTLSGVVYVRYFYIECVYYPTTIII